MRSALARGVWGHASPGNVLHFRPPEIVLVQFWGEIARFQQSVAAIRARLSRAEVTTKLIALHDCVMRFASCALRHTRAAIFWPNFGRAAAAPAPTALSSSQ